MGELWKGQDRKLIVTKKENLKKKTEMSIFVSHTHIIFLRLSTG